MMAISRVKHLDVSETWAYRQDSQPDLTPTHRHYRDNAGRRLSFGKGSGRHLVG
jgi:hypothetical protein